MYDLFRKTIQKENLIKSSNRCGIFLRYLLMLSILRILAWPIVGRAGPCLPTSSCICGKFSSIFMQCFPFHAHMQPSMVAWHRASVNLIKKIFNKMTAWSPVSRGFAVATYKAKLFYVCTWYNKYYDLYLQLSVTRMLLFWLEYYFEELRASTSFHWKTKNNLWIRTLLSFNQWAW